jgi:hypothetical protein
LAARRVGLRGPGERSRADLGWREPQRDLLHLQ